MIHATQIRNEATTLRALSQCLEDRAHHLQDLAADLQKKGGEDRDYIQKELDQILENHHSLLKEFLSLLGNESQLSLLKTNVEDGMASVMDIVGLSETLIRFRDGRGRLGLDQEELQMEARYDDEEETISIKSQGEEADRGTKIRRKRKRTRPTSDLISVDRALRRRHGYDIILPSIEEDSMMGEGGDAGKDAEHHEDSLEKRRRGKKKKRSTVSGRPRRHATRGSSLTD